MTDEMKYRRVLMRVKHADALPEGGTLGAMSWQELHESKKAQVSAMKAIMAHAQTEERDLTDEEQDTFDMLSKSVKRGVGAEISRRMELGDKAPRDPNKPFDKPQVISGSGAIINERSGWRDDSGRAVQMLRHDQRLASNGHNQMPGAALGHLVRHLATGDARGLHEVEQQIGASTSLLGGADPQGGYWVDPALANSIIDTARARSVALRAGVQTVPMTSSDFRMVRVEEDPTIEVVGEGNRITPSGIPFGALRLVAKKLACVISVSTELMEDASNLAAELDRLLGEAMATVIDGAILAGTAQKGGIVGILGSAGIQDEAAPGADKRLGWLNLLDSLQKLETANLSEDSSLILPPAMLRQLRGQTDSEGRFLTPPVDLADTPRWSSTQLPATSGIHGRFGEVVLGVRSELSIQVSPHLEFDKDKVLIRARWRGDVGLMRPAALVHLSDFDGTTT